MCGLSWSSEGIFELSGRKQANMNMFSVVYGMCIGVVWMIFYIGYKTEFFIIFVIHGDIR